LFPEGSKNKGKITENEEISNGATYNLRNRK
jgi:hypothetical protein